uniref:G-protein coupled receptors family 1 profile domain-containing protein n=1 Tax=Plectus sambesii TaxID=2011161 RepID=A0A914VWT4_9BILA
MNSTCEDIKEFLWQNTSDLTSIPQTMGIFGVLYSIVISLGICGNTFVILSVLRHRSLQSVRNCFIVSLSCSDIVVCCVSGSITPITAFTKVWLFGPELCHLVPLIQGVSLCFSTLTLTEISIDRFILIVYPTKRPIQKQHALRMIVFNCAVAVSLSLPMVFKQKLVDYGNFCGQFCTEDWGSDQFGRSTYGTVLFFLQFVVPLSIIAFCYAMICIRLGKGMLLRRDSEGGSEHLSEQRRLALKRRLRTNRMLIAMVVAFVASWLPSVVFNFLRDYEWLPKVVQSQEYLYGVITHCISMTSTVWNPVLYAWLNEQFRLAFLDLFKVCGQARRSNGSAYRLRSESSRMNTRCARLTSGAFLDGASTDGQALMRTHGDSKTVEIKWEKNPGTQETVTSTLARNSLTVPDSCCVTARTSSL